MSKKVKFTINVKMEERWVPQFLGMLDQMSYLGRVGSTRRVIFLVDGDGDFRSDFTWDTYILAEDPIMTYPEYDDAMAWKNNDGDTVFDAG